MIRALHVNPADATPIWNQIEEAVRRLVASGAMVPGSVIPSVRELARELRINPATVAKAYQRLVDARVLTVKRGEGTFVADHPPALEASTRRKLLHDGALKYASLAVTMSAPRTDALAEFERAWERLAGDGKGSVR